MVRANVFNLQSLLCVCLVLAIHIALIFALQSKVPLPRAAQSAPSNLQIVSIIEQEPKPDKAAKSRLGKEIQARRASISPSIAESTSKPSSQSNDLPKLDLDALRAGAVRQELGRERSLIELQAEKNRRDQSLEAKLGRAADQAQRTDCRSSYAQTGLLAPLFITADLLRDKGCKL